ncbi:uncharacterized protein LOC106092678 [Stomoxys calcitrans]|uniref:MD-2-related lipid-recognition domain-containing protein n=1 Tax=Stomoxys calcitrans TaxID=35570 RepID=A0A1I8P952_STOCA|nr:uncharacterized protein LOC106092678 [Stomoxys calcitrans]
MLKLVIIALLYQEVRLIIKGDWVKCSSNNEEFLKFEMCRLRYYKKDNQEFSYYAKLLKTVTHSEARLEATFVTPKKPLNLLNLTLDGCELLRGRKKLFAARRIFDIIAKNTNFNHSCPYTHDIFGTNLTLDVRQIPYAVPKGKYSLKVTFNVNRGASIIVVEGFGNIL